MVLLQNKNKNNFYLNHLSFPVVVRTRHKAAGWRHRLRTCPAADVQPGIGLMVRMVGFGSKGPELKTHSAVELIPGGVDSACHPSKVGKISASMLVYCVGVATRPGLCPIAKETA